MKYTRYPLPILGPARCHDCGMPVWWARRMSRFRGVSDYRLGWRDADGVLHRCADWFPRAVAAMAS